MNRPQIFIILLLLVLYHFNYGEGTKDLRPAEQNRGYLHLRPGDFDYVTPFGLYDSPTENQIKIRIKDTSETLYFGLNNRISNGVANQGAFDNNLPFRILSPSGQIVYESIIPSNGEEGHIPNWTQAVTGPMEIVGPGGYDALILEPEETGDYVIEFNPGQYTDIHLFDFSVADSTNAIKEGRLHSQGWQIGTYSFQEPFYGTVYPYHPDGIIYQVDFNEIQPYLFVINFNSYGILQTDDLEENRKSRNMNGSFPEFEVFLNPPDTAIFPTIRRELDFKTSVTNSSCEETSICISFETNAPGEVEGYIDFNGNGILDPSLGEFMFTEDMQPGDTTCIIWDGTDGAGNIIDQRSMQVISSFGYGIMHLPIFDAENNLNGFRVQVYSPDGLEDPSLFWDDSELAGRGNALDGLVQFDGCDNNSGCHRWANRGQDNNNSETINTWWYSQVERDTVVFQNLWNRPVQMSFDPEVLDQDARTICQGDSLTFYVFNDGFHYDTSFYTYDWFVEGNLVGETDADSIRIQVNNSINVQLRARDKDALQCESTSSLEAATVPPVEIEANIIDERCSDAPRDISISLISGPPNVQISWQEFPGNSDLDLFDLDTGTYHLSINDPSYSDRCALDTSFTLDGYPGIQIDDLFTDSSVCYSASGSARILMQDYLRDYEYNWNNDGFTKDSLASGLSPGNHTVLVRDTQYGCEADTAFSIFSKDLFIGAESSNELCSDKSGRIELKLPNENFDITWANGRKDRLINALSEGNYSVSINYIPEPSCSFDTVIAISNTINIIEILDIEISPSDCGTADGSAEIIMEKLNTPYEFSIGNRPFTPVNIFSNLAVGNYTIRVKEQATLCQTDTIIDIPGDGFSFEKIKEDDLCNSGNGNAAVIVGDPNVTILWNNGSDLFSREGLIEGTYSFVLQNPNSIACERNGHITISNLESDVEADFSYYSMVSSDVLGAGDVIQFMDASRGEIEHYLWDFNTGNISLQKNPEQIFDAPGSYTISLNIQDIYGCRSSIRKTLLLEERTPCDAALPNAFSPNRDGKNDDIGVLGNAFDIDLRIFNRWGEAVFRSYSTEERWNGNYRGKEASSGAYPFILEYSCPDNRGEMIKQKKVGDISLVR